MMTRQAAQHLGIHTPHLRSLIATGRMPAPQRDGLGHYVWSEVDLERARTALATDRRLKRQPAVACAS